MGKIKSESQKRMEEEDFQNYLEKFSQFKGFWKLDDKHWVETRNKSWNQIYEKHRLDDYNFNKTYWDSVGRFFLKAKPRKSDNRFLLSDILIYTPFENIDEIVNAFSEEHTSLQMTLHASLLTSANLFYKPAPKEFHRVKLIAEALYNKDYIAKKKSNDFDVEAEYIVTYPRDFIIQYASEAISYIECGNIESLKAKSNLGNYFYSGHERSFVEVTIDFFIGSINYAFSEKAESKPEKINRRGIQYVCEMCSLIENYRPDIDDANRNEFIEKAKINFLNNNNIQEIINGSGQF